MTMVVTSWLHRPGEDIRTPPEVETYMRARSQHRIHALILEELEKSGMSRADLARRTGKRPEVISRLLGQPGNWTLNTLSDLLFALSGSEISNNVAYPLTTHVRNSSEPDWLRDAPELARPTASSSAAKVLEYTM